MKKTIVLLITFLLIGCMTIPKPMSDSVFIGMTRLELVQKIGVPNDSNRSVDSLGVFDQYIYYHYDPFWGWQKDQVKYVYLLNGKVTGWSE
jgi:hypothetical protein